MKNRPKVIVIDDDPTGSQTVHSCLLLTRWDVENLRLGLEDQAPIFFILSNTRAMTPEQAKAVTVEICQNLKQAIAQSGVQDFLVVSRSDSTLRGHYPVETDAIAEILGPFDAHFLVPAFFEGGRFTRDSIHYLVVNGTPTPVHETEFAKDSVFAYDHSYLPDYVAQKTQGRIPAAAVTRFLLPDIRSGLQNRLSQLTNNQCCVVDAETQDDLNQFAADLLAAAAKGKRFLFRSAASLLTALAALPPQPIAAAEMSRYTKGAGVVLVGSHVKKTTEQLNCLLQEPNVVGVEIDISHLLEDSPAQRQSILDQTLERVAAIHQAAQTPVVYTSRQELTFDDIQARLQFGAVVSALLMDVVRGLPSDIGFLLSKGGITSNDVLSVGLELRSSRIVGQILAGCSVVITPPQHPRFPDLPVVLFPGNVGDVQALATVYRRLTRADYST